MTEGRDGHCGAKDGIGAPRANNGKVCAALVGHNVVVLGGSSLAGTAAGRWCCFVEAGHDRQAGVGAMRCRVSRECRW